LAADPTRTRLATDQGRGRLVAYHERKRLVSNPTRTRLAEYQGRGRLVAYQREILAGDSVRTRLAAYQRREKLAADQWRVRLATEPGHKYLAADQGGLDWLQTAHGRDWLQSQGMNTWLQTQGGLDWLQTPHGRDWLQAMRARLAANTPWTSMAVHSCSVCLGDDERILHDTASYERVCHHSRIAVTPSFPSSPAVQGLAGFLDVSNVPGIIAPRLFRLYITRRFFLVRLQRYHSCYECLYHFRKRSSRTKSISFRCSQVRL
jgi:hypothetical protein